MTISYARRNPGVRFAVAGTMVAGIFDSLSLMVEQTTTASIRQPQTEFSDLRFAASDVEITNSSSTSQNAILLRPVKTELGPAPWQQVPKVGNLENKAASAQTCQSMVDHFLVHLLYRA